MDLKSGYKQSELGAIPEDWLELDLKDIVVNDRPISYGIVQTGENVINGVKCIRVVDLVDGFVNDESLITTTETISNSYKRTILKEGDLVIALRGKIGEVAVIEKKLHGSNLTRGVALIALKSQYSSLFLKQQLRADSHKWIFESRLNGSALKEIAISVLRKIPVALPPTKEEQTAIANALSDTDALITSLEKLIAKKKLIKQGAMQKLLTGKMRLKGYTKEWRERELREIVDRFIVPMRDKPNHFSGNTPWCRIEDFDGKYLYDSKSQQYVDDKTIKEMNLKVLPEECLIVSCSADLGRCAIVKRPLVTNQTFIGLLVNHVKASNEFLFYYMSFNAERLNQLSSGTTISYLSREQFETFKIFVPPTRDEQAEIAEILHDMDAEIDELETKLEKYKMIKQGMMQNLLTGKIRLV